MGKPGDTAYGNRLPFGELFAEYPSNGWVHAVKWSPSGNFLAFCSHDSTVTIMDTGTRAAFEKFKTTDTTGVATVQSKLNTKHQNYVNSIQGCAGSAGNYSKVSTTGLDGKVVLWDL